MKSSRLLALALATPLLAAPLLFAEPATPAPTEKPPLFDTAVELSYAGRADISEGSRRLGKTDSFAARGSALIALPIDAQNVIVTGVETRWFNFSEPAGSPVPDHLGSVSVKLGLNHVFNSQWSARVDVDPGAYGDFSDGSGVAFAAPISFTAVYVASRELQWAAGVSIDSRSGTPVLGGIGVRWQFAPDWTLAFLPPAPRLEWTYRKDLMLFVGATLHGGTYRVSDGFGRQRGRPALDRQNVDYREISAIVGGRWQLARGAALQVSVGEMLDRRFTFDDRNLLLNGDSAPTIQVSFTRVF